MSTSPADAFTPLRLSAPDRAAATVYPHGAHVTSWTTPDGQERLFLSQTSDLRAGAAIRGGVPVVFPQFSRQGPLAPHGFARVLPWDVIGTRVDLASTPGGTTEAHLQLRANAATRAQWDHDFVLDLRVTVGGPRLAITLQVTNTGALSIIFNAALHTYLRVSDIAAVMLDGLGGLAFREHGADSRQVDPHLRIVGEVDRIYFDVPGPITLHDAAQRLEVTAEGFPDAVIWNPDPERAAAIADLEPGGYLRMVCIEAAAIGQPVTLAPGATWRGAQQIAVVSGEQAAHCEQKSPTRAGYV